MNLILFIHQNSSKKGVTFKKIIDQTFKSIETQTFQTFNSFKAKLKQASNYHTDIFILLADSNSRLKELNSLVDLIEDKRVIIILPDNLETTISKVHRFFPRYFTYVNDTYTDLCAVINKMLNNEKR
jgi:hypothetical protein